MTDRPPCGGPGRRLGAALALLAACVAPTAGVRVAGVVDLSHVTLLARDLPGGSTLAPGDMERPLDPATAARLDAVFADAMQRSGARAGSACVAVPGRGSWRAALAVAPLAVTTQSRFHAGSIGKAMTAALVLELVAEGRLGLETTIDRWFPTVPNAATITIDHLLAHTSGLVDPDVGPNGGERRWRSVDAVAAAVARGTPMFAPGTQWSYCNAGYQLLGWIVERERGAPFERVLQERLLTPLGLSSACVVTHDNQRQVLVESRHAGRSGFDVIDYAAPLAAGCVACSASDLVRWHCALLGGAVLPRPTAARMLDRLLPMGQGGLWWGRGLMLLQMPEPIGEVVFSAGGIKGFGSALAWLPSKRACIAVMVADETPPGPFLWQLANTL